MSKIKTTHVGSLPRSNELSDLLFKKDQKEKIDLNQFDEIVQRDVDNIVKKQIEVGIDYISDGEMSKISYATYVKDRIDGFSGCLLYTSPSPRDPKTSRMPSSA